MTHSRWFLATLLASKIFVLTAAAHGQTPPPPSTPEAPPPAAQPPATTVDASRGGITIASGVNSLTIGARVQFRFLVDDREAFDGDTTGTEVGEPDGPMSQFDVPRLRVTLSGGVFRPWLRYLFQFDFSRTGGEGDSKIKDAVIEIRPVGAPYRFAAGQFKAPFGLQQITSSGRLQFVDRAITDAKFNPGRDMGVMFSGTLSARRVGYDLGVFNGSGESVRENNQSHLWVGRVYFEPFGPYPLAEGSSDAVADPVLHVGAAVRAGQPIRGRGTPGVMVRADNQTGFSLEFAYKTTRFFSTAEHFWMSDEQENPIVGPTIDSRGFHAQAGYMVRPRELEVGLLVAHIDPDTRLDEAGLREIRGVVGYYWYGHNLKLQGDVGQLSYGAEYDTLAARARQGLPALGPRLAFGSRLSDTQVRLQLQLAF